MKDTILIKATELFLEQGFKSVTMDNLANEMGISKKTIYSNFANKNKLIEESTTHLLEAIAKGIDAIRALKKNPIEELYEIKKFVMVHLKDEKSSPQYQLQKYYPKIHSLMRKKQYEIMESCMVDNIKNGVTLGIFRNNLNIDFVARIYFSGVTSIKDHKLFPLSQFPITKLMDNYLEYHLRGIVTPAGRHILNTIINSNQE